jgi:bacteriocin-like protein
MREVTEMPMHELTDAELDAVSGGFFDIGNTVFQLNAVGAQLGVALGGLVLQGIGQSNTSTI